MSNHKMNRKQESNEAVMDFISGNINTDAAKHLTKNIKSLRSLWLLAKMSGDIKKNEKNSLDDRLLFNKSHHKEIKKQK